PLLGCKITFHPAGEGAPISTGIDEKGAYRVPIAFSGEAKVTVSNEDLKSREKVDIGKVPGVDQEILDKQKKMMEEKMKNMSPEQRASFEKLYMKHDQQGAGKYVEIPKKYADKKASPLTVTIKGGSQVEDFDVTN